jgi:demethylmenaquinone methyltransferase/2-methoxy-6-polyprenyl-1,4-benzoquinol methylase
VTRPTSSDWTKLVEEQKEYYRERAPEYDDWWFRQGRYDHGPESNREWWLAVDQLDQALSHLGPLGDTLELAAGTGIWTEKLAAQSAHVTAIDASTEVLDINRNRCAGSDVDYILTDVFTWQPTRQYDTVFFGFWLSHVPPDRFAAFWDVVGQALRESGRVMFIDSLPAEESGALDHDLPDWSSGRVTRRLSGGAQFEIVKLFYEPTELESQLAGLGWKAEVQQVGRFFLLGHASRFQSPASR